MAITPRSTSTTYLIMSPKSRSRRTRSARSMRCARTRISVGSGAMTAQHRTRWTTPGGRLAAQHSRSDRESIMELSGQVAIVTGAGRGIGRATALELAQMGADIVVAELDREGAEHTAAEVKGLGRRVSVVRTDVTSRNDLKAMAERARAELGRIDILVNNAGIYRAALPLDVTEEHWDAIMNVNAKAVFFASQAVLPAMIAQKRGAIVSLASMAGKVGSRNNLPYNASKAAVVSMKKSLTLAHAADDIRVNCVCPGFVETDMWTSVAREQGKLMGLTPEEFTRRRADTVPLGRMERPEDVANVIGFLVSSKSSYMTGQALSVDGGLVMH